MLALAACVGCHEQAPGGQVLAVVNGDEITIPELNSEARARGLVIADNLAVRNALLQELIDRRLLAQAAHDRGIDHTPEYILASRRAAETALVQEFVTDAGRSATEPTPQQIDAFIAANPQAFGRRAIVTVEQMALPGPIPATKLGQIVAAGSLERAAASLGNVHLADAKALQSWDTARLDPESGLRLSDLAVGGLAAFHPPGSGWVMVRKISQSSSPVLPEQQASFAASLAKAQNSQAFVARILSEQRARAHILVGSKPARAQR